MFKFFHPPSKEESVYNLVTNEEESGNKSHKTSPIYRSIYSGQVRKELVSNKSGSSKTLGVPHILLDTPSTFLKKHSKRPFSTRPQSVPGPSTLSVEKGSQAGGEQVEADEKTKIEQDKKPLPIRPKTCARLCNDNRKPGIQPAHVPLQILIQENKDFVKTNASSVLDNSKLTVKPKMLRYVDMSNGNTELWYNSGLAPQYIQRRNFGKVPTYIMKRNQELRLAKEALEQDAAAAKKDSDVQKLGKDEINRMITGLKDNWNHVFNLYQSLPLLIDTPGKIKTKSRLEVQLKKLEKDIQTLQRHDFIYVADVPRSYYVPALTKRG